MDETARKVEEHYGDGGLRDRIRAGLEAMGLDPDHLDPDGPTGPDEFHTGGRPMTVALAELAGIATGERVIDVGCGLGGPARVLAHHFGAQVTGIDLTNEFVALGKELTTATGLDDAVDLRVGDATVLPFDDGAFDVGWTQHATMNMPDKAAVYRELRRVVRDGGRFAFFDIIAGPNVADTTYPLPWASDVTTSFLEDEDTLRAELDAAGWHVRVWNDVTEASLAFYDIGGQPLPPGHAHPLSADFPTRIANLGTSTRAGATRVIQAVCDTTPT
jgi:MPBQ/MSBQ methyltransferase